MAGKSMRERAKRRDPPRLRRLKVRFKAGTLKFMEQHPLTQKETAELFKALADESRLRILNLLLDKEMCVTEITQNLNLSQSLVSHHLKILKIAELVDSFRMGQKICYRLHPAVQKSLSQSKNHTLDLKCCEISFKSVKTEISI